MLQDFLFLHPQFAPSGCTLLTLLPARGGPVLLNRRCPPGRILTHSKATFLPCALGPNQLWAPSQLPPSSRTSTPTASVLMQISYFFIGLEKLKMAKIWDCRCVLLYDTVFWEINYQSGQNLVIKLRRNLLGDIYASKSICHLAHSFCSCEEEKIPLLRIPILLEFNVFLNIFGRISVSTQHVSTFWIDPLVKTRLL